MLLLSELVLHLVFFFVVDDLFKILQIGYHSTAYSVVDPIPKNRINHMEKNRKYVRLIITHVKAQQI